MTCKTTIEWLQWFMVMWGSSRFQRHSCWLSHSEIAGCRWIVSLTDKVTIQLQQCSSLHYLAKELTPLSTSWAPVFAHGGHLLSPWERELYPRPSQTNLAVLIISHLNTTVSSLQSQICIQARMCSGWFSSFNKGPSTAQLLDYLVSVVSDSMLDMKRCCHLADSKTKQ